MNIQMVLKQLHLNFLVVLQCILATCLPAFLRFFFFGDVEPWPNGVERKFELDQS